MSDINTMDSFLRDGVEEDHSSLSMMNISTHEISDISVDDVSKAEEKIMMDLKVIPKRVDEKKTTENAEIENVIKEEASEDDPASLAGSVQETKTKVSLKQEATYERAKERRLKQKTASFRIEDSKRGTKSKKAFRRKKTRSKKTRSRQVFSSQTQDTLPDVSDGADESATNAKQNKQKKLKRSAYTPTDDTPISLKKRKKNL